MFLRLVPVIMAMSLSACAMWGGSDVLVTECVLHEAQASTLLGSWPVLPIPLALNAASQFSQEEAAAVEAAAESWNRFYSGSRGVRVFDYGSPGAFRVTNSTRSTSSMCAGGLIAGQQYTGHVIIQKRTAWPSNLQGAIAVTAVCRSPASPLYKSYMALLELNYQSFFVAGQKQPDLRSIMLHEFGHLLGLDHSCLAGDARNGFPSCNSNDVDPDYLAASMFPTVGFNGLQGEVRRSLNINDQGRGNCLYEGPNQDMNGYGQQGYY